MIAHRGRGSPDEAAPREDALLLLKRVLRLVTFDTCTCQTGWTLHSLGALNFPLATLTLSAGF